MNWTIGPTFKLLEEEISLIADLSQSLQTVTALPLYQVALTEALGEVLDCSDPSQPQSLAVPIPRLPGLDEFEIRQMNFALSSSELTDSVTVSGSSVPDSGGLAMHYAPSQAGAPVRLTRIELENLKLHAGGVPYALRGDQRTGTDRTIVLRQDDGKLVTVINGDTAGAQFAHVLIRPASKGGYGPPLAAVPYFEMPGNGDNLYGPALGGATLTLTHSATNPPIVKAVVTLTNPLPMASFQLLIGSAGESNPHGGLPNDVAGIGWSADTITAFYDVRPAGVTVRATVENGTDQPVVAQFDTDLGNAPVSVDFAPVARSLLNAAYPTSQGDDLGLKLIFDCASPGKLRVNLGEASARYLRYPLGGATLTASLLGAAEEMTMAVPEGLTPEGMSFTLDGIYGPMRLVTTADQTPGESRRGFRLNTDQWLARRISLTEAERTLPMGRVALWGRAGRAGELLVTLHGGDAVRMGPAISPPLSIPTTPSSEPQWHRALFPAGTKLPPGTAELWIVVRATGGDFWWHAAMEGEGQGMRSPDDDLSWEPIAASPFAQLAVVAVDEATGQPAPLDPITLSWAKGVLNGDVVGVSGQESQLGPQFRRFWVAQAGVHATFLDVIGALQGQLRLRFNCRRDVDLSLSNLVLVCNPWRAGEQ
jgi:hypothetical protein